MLSSVSPTTTRTPFLDSPSSHSCLGPSQEPQCRRPPAADGFPRSVPEEALGAFRTFLSSMAPSSSNGVVDQAKEIEKGPGMPPSKDGEGDKAASAADGNNNRPQGRRPALSRKRAKFSMKPISQSDTADVDISSQIDHIEDPEEYFMTFEQLENAEKELKKLRVESLPGKFHQPNPTVRTQRPGILGKTASLKHSASATDDIAEVLRSSQEDATTRRTSLSNASFIASSNAVEQPIHSPLNKDNESGADKDNNSNNLLDSLLSSFKNLKEGEEAAFLKESLQLKAIAVDNVLLPDFQVTKKNVFRATSTKMMGSKSSGLPSILASPIQERISFGEISNLYRHTSFKDPIHDLDDMSSSDDECNASKNQEKPSCSSAVNVGHSSNGLPSDHSSGPGLMGVKSSNLSDKLEIPVSELDISPDSRIMTQKKDEVMLEVSMAPGHIDFGMKDPDPVSADFRENIILACPLANRSQECSPRIAGEVIPRSSDMTVTLGEVDNRELDDMRSDQQDLEVEDLTFSSAYPAGTNDSVKSLMNKNEDHIRADDIIDNGIGETDDIVNLQAADSEMNEPARALEISLDHSLPMASVELMDGQSTNASNLSVRDNETEGCRHSSLSRNKEKKNRSSRTGQNKQKMSSRRQSLSDAGTIWKSGLRRSTRIKSRPLEFWRGERFLYGRIDDSLSTVIGIKYSSSGADSMEIKSFVSEEYTNLVDLAARN